MGTTAINEEHTQLVTALCALLAVLFSEAEARSLDVLHMKGLACQTRRCRYQVVCHISGCTKDFLAGYTFAGAQSSF